MNDEIFNDPALSPFLGKNKNSDGTDRSQKSDKSKSSNTLPKDVRFPEKQESYYINTYEDVASELLNDSNYKEDFDKLLGMQGRIYKLDNHNPSNKMGYKTSRKLVIVNLLLLYLGDDTFNSVILGSNINEYVYFQYTNNRIGVLFTRQQKVNYPDGEDGRRATLGKDYRILVDEVYKFAKKYLAPYR